jgi:hypothetical protein
MGPDDDYHHHPAREACPGEGCAGEDRAGEECARPARSGAVKHDARTADRASDHDARTARSGAGEHDARTANRASDHDAAKPIYADYDDAAEDRASTQRFEAESVRTEHDLLECQEHAAAGREAVEARQGAQGG